MEKPTILFVADDAIIIKNLRRIFLDEPYRIIFAESSDEGLEVISNGENPQVIVTDENTSGINGLEFLAKVKAIQPDSIRIILTDYANIDAIMAAITKSVLYQSILKPWSDTDLRIAVLRATEQYKILSENKNLNRSLKEKIRELKGRDRVLRHILTIHPLEETLQVILDSLVYILRVDSAAVYLPEDSGKRLKVAAAYCHPVTNSHTRDKELIEFGPRTEHAKLAQEVFYSHMASIGQTDDPNDCDNKFSVITVPVMKKTDCLGVIHVVKKPPPQLNMADVCIIGKLSIHTAIAISDAQVQIDIPDWQETLENALNSNLLKD